MKPKQLFTREWGTGDRVAVLIHGIMADSRCWWRVGPALAELGYHVVAVDLPGHGESDREPDYTPELLAERVIDSVPRDPVLAIGHSIGGLTLALAVERLRPYRAIYSDPAFRLPGAGVAENLMAAKHSTRDQIRAVQPTWPDEEVDLELKMLAGWDPETARLLETAADRDFTPAPVVPSLVQVADPSFLVPPAFAAELESRGFEVRTVERSDHTIHRDTFERFMGSLRDWLI
ncbi:alpha/beta fold hydrolase [Sinosporangium siamense]|uniref:alpha/beta fold hydrolase n=1 Tax=Sinosporangium siamense TaxID=1367973 RepID=UPI001951034A|nr:alpha/beta hydrolase [Sinosporangium siamense]